MEFYLKIALFEVRYLLSKRGGRVDTYNYSRIQNYYRVPVFYHLIVTDECNLCCRYCREKAFEPIPEEDEPDEGEIDCDLPVDLSLDLKELYQFLAKDPDAVLTFYGGEPLLRPDLVTEIVRNAPVKRFMMQTNGILIPKLPDDVIRKFELIHVSIDGPEDLTDFSRGKGTYRKVIDGARYLRTHGFNGELNARMTVTEATDIQKAVLYLMENPDFCFNSIHWQLDADFWNDFQRRTFAEWAENNYNPGIHALVRYWITKMHEGTVLRWYPFLDTMEDLLLGRDSRLRCGSGYADYTILTDGSIVPCPVMIGMKDYYLGHVATTDPNNLPEVTVTGDCLTCDIRTFCGGRCLYSNIIRPWKPEERAIVCDTVRNLHDSLQEVLPEVKECIRRGEITLEDFAHTKFNGCEIIP